MVQGQRKRVQDLGEVADIFSISGDVKNPGPHDARSLDLNFPSF
jgi:hypothetical protein